MSDAVEALRAGMDRTLARLAALVEVPGVSAKAFPPKEVRRSAEATTETLGECGM